MNAVKVESLSKQFMVNNMALPYDLKQMINGFCFYDTKTWELMEFMKKKHGEINRIFKFLSFSSRRIDGTVSCWEFKSFRRQMLGVNCSKCGDYRDVSSPEKWDRLSDTMKCSCPPPPLEFPDFDDESMGEMWEPDTQSTHYSDYEDYDF